jgi:hypothetical protein
MARRKHAAHITKNRKQTVLSIVVGLEIHLPQTDSKRAAYREALGMGIFFIVRMFIVRVSIVGVFVVGVPSV